LPDPVGERGALQVDAVAGVDAYMEITSYDGASFSCLLVEDEGESDDEDDGWTPPWELDEDDPLRWAEVTGHTKNSRADGPARPRHPSEYVEIPFERLDGDLMVGLHGELHYE
jgi:hypothetical protein